jgi:hypothetical protein
MFAKRHTVGFLILLAICASGPTARAAARPLLFAGFQTTSSEKTELDKLLDPYTIHNRTNRWDAGAGLRLFTFRGSYGRQTVPPWEFQFRLGFGGGTLPGSYVSGRRFLDRSSVDFTSKESFKYTTWAFGTAIVANVRPQTAFYVQPALQTVKYKATRAWTGPSGCYLCGDATDQATSRYGLIEIGAQWKPVNNQFALEGYWIPRRFELSSTHIVRSQNYKAD